MQMVTSCHTGPNLFCPQYESNKVNPLYCNTQTFVSQSGSDWGQEWGQVVVTYVSSVVPFVTGIKVINVLFKN